MPEIRSRKNISPIIKNNKEALNTMFLVNLNGCLLRIMPVSALVTLSKDPPLLENQNVITEKANPEKNMTSINRTENFVAIK